MLSKHTDVETAKEASGENLLESPIDFSIRVIALLCIGIVHVDTKRIDLMNVLGVMVVCGFHTLNFLLLGFHRLRGDGAVVMYSCCRHLSSSVEIDRLRLGLQKMKLKMQAQKTRREEFLGDLSKGVGGLLCK